MTSPWDERYGVPDYVFGTEPNGFLRSQEARVRGHGKALCVADGEGRNGVWLAGLGLEVTAIDSSAVGQEKARALAAERGVVLETVLVDVEDYRWPENGFDLVVGIFIQFCGPAARARMFEGMKRALSPGGTLILEGYRPEQLAYGTGGPSEIENLYTEALLRDAFGDLDIVSLDSRDAVMDEGIRHQGMSALIELVAVKPR